MDTDDELCRKTGRNLLLFQKAEHLLKLLSCHGRFTLRFGDDHQEAFTKHITRIANETLGQVSNTVIGTIFRASAEEDLLADPSDAGSGISFYSVVGEPAAERYRQLLSDLVRERNRFVHRLYSKIQLADSKSHESICLHLDEQHERFAPLISELEQLQQIIVKQWREMFDLLDEKETRELILVAPSRIILLLNEIIDQISDRDGWASLREAVQKIDVASASIREELQRCDKKSLSELLLASRLFELKPVPSDLGGTRMLFRRIPEQRPKQLLPDSPNSISLSSPDFWSLLEADDDAPPLHFHFCRGLGYCHGPSIAISCA